jgi:hypothetical protein
MNLHTPGMGWHMIDRDFSSENAIIAHVSDICTALGLRLDTLWREAYPDEDVPDAMPEPCARPATVADAQAVIEDLEDVNFHSFNAVFIKAVAAKGATVDPAYL